MATLHLTAIPCVMQNYATAQSFITNMSDMHHRENTIEARDFRGKITAERAKELARECATLAVAERPTRYPAWVCVSIRVAKGDRAPAGFKSIPPAFYFDAKMLERELDARTGVLAATA